MQRQQVEQGQTEQGTHQQAGMVAACIDRTQTDRQRVLTVQAIAVDIPQVVNIEHRCRQHAAGGGWQEQRRNQGMRL